MDALATANPGTVIATDTTDEGRFSRAFFCLSACIQASLFCRLVVMLDACHLKSTHGGTLFSASAQDGNGNMVPLASGFGPVENEENWRFFLGHLKRSLPILRDNDGHPVFISDREKVSLH